MDLNIRQYRVVKCVICKTYQMTSAQITFRCIKCQKSKPIKKMTIHYQSDIPSKTTQILKQIKKEDFIQRNENIKEGDEDIFKSAF